MAKKEKIKLAFYWAATCGGCDVATLDIEEKILDVVNIADIVLWPVAMDFKYKDVEKMGPNSIDICLFNGAVRNSEHEEIAKMLRARSKVMIAFGSCACFGGIPGLANVANREQIFRVAYKDTPSTVNPEFVIPMTECEVAGEKLSLPGFWDTVKTLEQTVDVDYYVPGCPPAVDRINDAIGIIAKYAETGELPPKGTVVASDKSLCDECPRERAEERKLKWIYRPYEIKPETNKCLLDQGILCMGPATRGGCGARCLNANMPCRGCMGPTAMTEDHKMTGEEVEELVSTINDQLGTFYRFTLPASLLRRVIIKQTGVKK